jgi:hypothetical protein
MSEETKFVQASRVNGELSRHDDFQPVMTIEQAVVRYNTIVGFAKQVLHEGRDFGVIPGTEKKPKGDGTPTNKNNVLLKPGAEKLCSLFGLSADFLATEVVKDWGKGFFYFEYKCVLSRTGNVIATCIGSCNSREKKFRRGVRICPECGAGAIQRSKYPPRNNPGAEPVWYCYSKAGGCGKEFAADDRSITEQTQVVDADGACDMVNTLQKMAQKRAYVGACLQATGASEFFTQDIEDIDFAVQVDPDAADVSAFLDTWDSIALGHGFSHERGRELLDAKCRKQNRDVKSLDLATRKNWLASFDAITPEQAGKLKGNAPPKDQAAPEPTTPSAPAGIADSICNLKVTPWPAFREHLYGVAQSLNIAPSDMDAMVGDALLKLGRVGEQGKVTQTERAKLLSDLHAQAGSFSNE